MKKISTAIMMTVSTILLAAGMNILTSTVSAAPAERESPAAGQAEDTRPVLVEEESAPQAGARAFDLADGTDGDASPIEVLEIIEEGDRSTLRIRNRTPFITIVYIHGVRVGWLRPFRTGRMRGLKRGFHRLYAHSRWGSFYWGPRSIWVPGTWNLYR